MSFEELYPTINEQSKWAIRRYDPLRADKQQELRALCFEKYLNDLSNQKAISKQNYKCFITQRAKEVDFRSVAKGGYGGTSRTDPLSPVNRRSTSDTSVVEYSDWMSFKGKENDVENNYIFQMDLKKFIRELSLKQRKIFQLKSIGWTLKEIASKMELSVSKVFNTLMEIKNKFMKYFQLQHACA